MLDVRELAVFAGLALLLALFSLARARRAGRRLDRWSALAAVFDVLTTTLVLALVAVYPSVYGARTGPFTGWLVGVGFYVVLFAKFGRSARLALTGFVMTIVVVWCLFSPGWDELVRGWTPARLATPPLASGELPADTVYTLQAIEEGLPLSRSTEPRQVVYPLLWLLAVAGLILDARSLPASGNKEQAVTP
jgi:hypothetical protein